jgi:hypothetical protein
LEQLQCSQIQNSDGKINSSKSKRSLMFQK